MPSGNPLYESDLPLTTGQIRHEGEPLYFEIMVIHERLYDAEKQIEQHEKQIERQKIMLDAFTDVAVENRLRIDALERVVKRLVSKVEIDGEEIKNELIAEMEERAKAILKHPTQGVTAPLQTQDSNDEDK